MNWQRRRLEDLQRLQGRLTALDNPGLTSTVEASWYGPLCKYMESQVGDSAMLKPQAPIRERAEEDPKKPEQNEPSIELEIETSSEIGSDDESMEVDDSSESFSSTESDDSANSDRAARANISLDSHGTWVKINTTKYPDFTLCRFTAGLHSDVLKAIIEVKLPGHLFEAESQVTRYLDSYGDESVVGLGISGKDVAVIVVDPSRARADGTGGWRVTHKMKLLSQDFLDHINRLANL